MTERLAAAAEGVEARLPNVHREMPETNGSSREERMKLESGGRRGRAALVVVGDDDDATRVLLRTLLGFLPEVEVVGEATNGAEAVELAIEHEADLVLLDVNMPVMDGLAAAEALAARRPQAQLLLHTAEPNGEKWRRAEELGVRILVKNDFEETIAELSKTASDGARPGESVPRG